jgi:hypothetical protein
MAASMAGPSRCVTCVTPGASATAEETCRGERSRFDHGAAGRARSVRAHAARGVPVTRVTPVTRFSRPICRGSVPRFGLRRSVHLTVSVRGGLADLLITCPRTALPVDLDRRRVELRPGAGEELASAPKGRFNDLCDTASAALIQMRDHGLLSLGEEFWREERRKLVYRSSRTRGPGVRELYEGHD